MAYKNKEDQASSAKKHYEANKDKIKARSMEWSAKQRKLLAELSKKLRTIPCMDCHNSYPYYVMDFDHVRGKKTRNLSTMVGRAVSTSTFMEEVAKCDIVCSNCHRARTHFRRHGSIG